MIDINKEKEEEEEKGKKKKKKNVLQKKKERTSQGVVHLCYLFKRPRVISLLTQKLKTEKE